MTVRSSAAADFAFVRSDLLAGADPVGRVAESCRRAVAVADQGIFTSLVAPEIAIARAEALGAQKRSGASLPLLGLTFSVKDNIHVAGMPTTSNCPALSILPDESAFVVQAVEAAGAVLIGKNTMDQFATGLNGTRTLGPLCRNAVNPAYIPGGSSSGSAVAVARDIVSFSLGTDTGGSGRVPAACNGIVGLKPTPGLVSNRGLLFNSRYFDCVPVFARRCADAYEVLETIAGYDALDPYSRRDAGHIDFKRSSFQPKRLAVPALSQCRFFGDELARRAFEADLAVLNGLGCDLVEMDFTLFEEAGRLVFESPMVAERLVEYQEILSRHPEAVHSAVRGAIEAGARFSARDAFETLYRLKALQRLTQDRLADLGGLVVPTIPTIFTIEAMLAAPVERNTIMGTYTYFASPLDLCAISVPGRGRDDGLPSALCFVGLPAMDGAIGSLAEGFEAAIAISP